MIDYRTLAAALALTAAPIVAQAQVENERFDVLFPFDSAQLTAEGRQAVADAAQAYGRGANADIYLRGTTDTVGSQQYNLELSERRAQAVQQALVEMGVPPNEISADWSGEQNLPVPTEDGVRLQANRSVQIQVAREAPQPAPQPVAQPEPEPEQDVGFRFALAPFAAANLGGFSDDVTDDSAFLGANLTASYELTPALVAEAEQAIFYNGWAEDEGVGGRTAGGLNFQLPPGTVPTMMGDFLPYVGGNIGYIYSIHNTSIDDEWFAGPEVGLRVGPIEAKVAYDIPFNDDPWDDGAVSATIGAGWRF